MKENLTTAWKYIKILTGIAAVVWVIQITPPIAIAYLFGFAAYMFGCFAFWMIAVAKYEDWLEEHTVVYRLLQIPTFPFIALLWLWNNNPAYEDLKKKAIDETGIRPEMIMEEAQRDEKEG